MCIISWQNGRIIIGTDSMTVESVPCSWFNKSQLFFKQAVLWNSKKYQEKKLDNWDKTEMLWNFANSNNLKQVTQRRRRPKCDF